MRLVSVLILLALVGCAHEPCRCICEVAPTPAVSSNIVPGIDWGSIDEAIDKAVRETNRQSAIPDMREIYRDFYGGSFCIREGVDHLVSCEE
ncbi:hypothetical protein LCGC14_2603830 [marine sediment metagenome]|uniref:Lipoprotein n=1 Tax=marine sediment metagenome TaxID=412755 RepID=A0A0F9CIX0_9ZZZZ